VRIPPWTISPLKPENASELFAASETLMEALYPAESNHVVGPEAFTGDDALLIGAFVGEKPVGCGVGDDLPRGSGSEKTVCR
jgi:hypothetical protein